MWDRKAFLLASKHPMRGSFLVTSGRRRNKDDPTRSEPHLVDLKQWRQARSDKASSPSVNAVRKGEKNGKIAGVLTIHARGLPLSVSCLRSCRFWSAVARELSPLRCCGYCWCCCVVWVVVIWFSCSLRCLKDITDGC